MSPSVLKLVRPTRAEFTRKCVDARQPAVLSGLTDGLCWDRDARASSPRRRLRGKSSPSTWLEGDTDHLITTLISDDAEWRSDRSTEGSVIPVGAFLSEVRRKKPRRFAVQASLMTHAWVMDRFPITLVESFVDLSDIDQASLWLQGSGNKTHLHYDDMDNINFLLQGSKRLVLYPPHQLDKMYSVRAFGDEKRHHPNWSMVDVFSVDHARFPRFAQAESLTVDLNGGDTLYLPACWWHQVSTTAPSFGINFWVGLTEAHRQSTPYADWYRPYLRSNIRRHRE